MCAQADAAQTGALLAVWNGARLTITHFVRTGRATICCLEWRQPCEDNPVSNFCLLGDEGLELAVYLCSEDKSGRKVLVQDQEGSLMGTYVYKFAKGIGTVRSAALLCLLASLPPCEFPQHPFSHSLSIALSVYPFIDPCVCLSTTRK